MAMGTDFCADRLGLPRHQPLCGMVHMSPMPGLQHALRSQGGHGVLPSFTDFLQGKGKKGGKPLWREVAEPKGAISNEYNSSGEMQNPHKGQTMCLFFPPKAAGKPGVGKGYGMQSKTGIERLGKGSNDSILGRVKLSPWGPGHRGIVTMPAVPMAGGTQVTPVEKGRKGRAKGHPGRAADAPVENHCQGRGSFVKALEVASCKIKLQAAVRELNKGYWAKSTMAVKMSRREEVATLAKTVAGQNQFLPLSKEVVEAVAAALKAAGLASADQYLNELKLLHIEAGFHLEQWLARTFQLCKKSVVRERGPVKRAMEFQLEDVALEAWTMTSDVAVSRATLAYAWGVAWMLREVELSKVCWEHISWNMAKKTVRLYIPSSKTDQRGLGVARTLQCCGLSPCWKGCAWFLIQELIALRSSRHAQAGGPVFPNQSGKCPTKAEMISSWKTLLAEGVSGHSARRSGAMAYVRKGLDIKELAYLGRWKSAVVLTYAEEALETTPANRAMVGNGPAIQSDVKRQEKIVVHPVIKEGATGDGRAGGEERKIRKKAASLWVKSTGCRTKTPLHLITNADWSIPMAEWTSACGWAFARRTAQISFVTDPSLAMEKCKKCLAMNKLRDEVKKGTSPAQLIAADVKQVGIADLADGCNRPQHHPGKRRRVEGGNCMPSEAVLKV